MTSRLPLRTAWVVNSGRLISARQPHTSVTYSLKILTVYDKPKSIVVVRAATLIILFISAREVPYLSLKKSVDISASVNVHDQRRP